jgi:hypothetical protein
VRLRVLAAAALCLIAAGCGGGGCGRQERGGPEKAPPAPDTVAVAPEGDAGDSTWFASLPSAAGDSLLTSMSGQLGPWVARWQGVLPSFALDSLRRGPEQPLHLVGDRPFRMSYLKEREGLLVASPNGRRFLDPDRYLQIIEDHGHRELGTDVDSSPALADLDRDSLLVIDFVGPSGRFEDGFWLGPDRFVLTFHGERSNEPWRGGGIVEVFDLKRMTQRNYYTPDVGETAYDRYEDFAWRDLKRRLLSKPPVS